MSGQLLRFEDVPDTHVATPETPLVTASRLSIPAEPRARRDCLLATGRLNLRLVCSACKWHSATARASAASDGSGISCNLSNARTISCPCRLSAWPYPATEDFTSRGE